MSKLNWLRQKFLFGEFTNKAIACFIFCIAFLVLPNITSATALPTKLDKSTFLFSESLLRLEKNQLVLQKALVGENIQFFVDPGYDSMGRDTLTASLRLTSEHAYFFIEDDYWNSLDVSDRTAILSNLSDLANEFDKVIYAKEREAYGSEWDPGIDNDPHITILLSRIDYNAGGYFNPNDEYPKNQIIDGRSNEREIVYLNVAYLGKQRIRSFLAHEFQHLINWNLKKRLQNLEEEVWLNEALSEYASTLLDYDSVYSGSNLEARVKNFLADSSDSLTEWQNRTIDYSPVNLFMQYLVGHYGKNILAKAESTDSIGISAINSALSRLGINDTFSDIFTNWAVTNYVNDEKIGLEKKYAYDNINLKNIRVKPTASFILTSDTKGQGLTAIKDWAGHWYEFKSVGTSWPQNIQLKINFKTENKSSNFKIRYVTIDASGTNTVYSMTLNPFEGTAYIPFFGSKISKVTMVISNQSKTTGFGSVEPLTAFSYSYETIAKSVNPPEIYSVSPLIGKTSGGEIVTLTGKNFMSGAQIFFGDKQALNIEILDSSKIRAVAPANGKSAEVSISITNSDGSQSTSPTKYIYFDFHPDGTLLRGRGDYKVYVTKENFRRWLQGPEIFDFYPHLSWANIIEIEQNQLSYYQEVPLIRADGDYKVYEVNGDGTKHWLNMTPEQFITSGRRWEMVQIVNTKERDFYHTGPDVVYVQ